MWVNAKKSIFSKAPRLWHTCAYLVSQKGAGKIINNIQPMRAHPIDEYFGDLVDQKKLRALCNKRSNGHLKNVVRSLKNGQLSSIIQKQMLIYPSFN